MTRRELPIPVDDVENQSRYLDISDGFSERSSTLPTYEDAVRDTLSSAMEDSKGGDRKTPLKEQVLPSLSYPDANMHRESEEQSDVMRTSEDRNGSKSQQDKPKERKASLMRKLFWILAIVFLYNLLAHLLFSYLEPGKYTPPPSEPESESEGSSWPSAREIRIHETTNAIHGTYPLYDLLELSTLTGAIHVTIEPKSGNRTAVVKIKSKTGAINVRFAKSAFSNSEMENNNYKGVFERVYNTRMDTNTGQIYADVLHGGAGGETVLTTKTGLLDLRVTPVGDEASRIETSTATGLNKVTVEAPMQGITLKNLTAVHRTRSTGMLDVHYPPEWEGRVHAWCRGTGAVDVQGMGLNFQRGGKDVYAWRGNDASKNGNVIEVVSEGTGFVRFRA